MIGPYYVNNEARRIAAWGQPCNVPWGKATINSKTYSVHRDTVSAWEVLDTIRANHNYVPTGTDTGFYNCRRINHRPAPAPWSAHAWATALDLNWLQNPAGSKLVTDMPLAMIRELQSVKTVSGVFVFMWGGDWDRDPTTSHTFYDAMHWEVIAHPLDLASGIVGPSPRTTPKKEQYMDHGLRAGERGGDVKALQIHLNAWRPDFDLVEDGIFGTGANDGGRTGAALAEYQLAAGREVNSLFCDATTFALIATNGFRDPHTRKRLEERTP
jgi:hypothetical protein